VHVPRANSLPHPRELRMPPAHAVLRQCYAAAAPAVAALRTPVAVVHLPVAAARMPVAVADRMGVAAQCVPAAVAARMVGVEAAARMAAGSTISRRLVRRSRQAPQVLQAA